VLLGPLPGALLRRLDERAAFGEVRPVCGGLPRGDWGVGRLQAEGGWEESFQSFTEHHMLFKRTYHSFDPTELIYGLPFKGVDLGVELCAT